MATDMSIKKILAIATCLLLSAVASAGRPRMCARNTDSLYTLKADRGGLTDSDILSSTHFCNAAHSAFLLEKALNPQQAVKTANRIFALTSIDDADHGTSNLHTDAACFLAEQGDLKWARMLSNLPGMGRGILLAGCMAKSGDYSQAQSRIQLLRIDSEFPLCMSRSDLPFFQSASGVRREFIDQLKVSLLSKACAYSALDILVELKQDRALVEEIEQYTESKLREPTVALTHLVQVLALIANKPEHLVEHVSKCALRANVDCILMLKRLGYVVNEQLPKALPECWLLDSITSVCPSEQYRISQLYKEPVDAIWDAEVKLLTYEDRRRLTIKLIYSDNGRQKIERIIALGLLPLDIDLRQLITTKFGLRNLPIARNGFQRIANRPSRKTLKKWASSTSFQALPWTSHVVLTNALPNCKKDAVVQPEAVSDENIRRLNIELVAELDNCFRTKGN
jgi:hypothetical protein